MKHLKVLSYILGVGIMMTACQKPNLGPQVSLNSNELSVFPLDATHVEIKSKHEGLTTNIYVNQLIKVTENWARAHFKPNATSGTAVLEFDEIFGKDTPFPREKGVTTLFKTEQAGKLEAVIALKISIQDRTGFTRKYLEVRVNRSQTYPDKATLSEKEKIWTSVMNAILIALNDKLKEAMGG